MKTREEARLARSAGVAVAALCLWPALARRAPSRSARARHSFQVRPTDAAGNTDPTPATQSWKVKKKRKTEGSKT
jgi:hypothetical protein